MSSFVLWVVLVWHGCRSILPSLLVSFSPSVVSLALSSDAWMKPFLCLSVIRKASRISFSGSSCWICRCIMVRKVEKSTTPDFSEHREKDIHVFQCNKADWRDVSLCASQCWNMRACAAPILWTCRCLSISPMVGLVPRHRITVIRSLGSILPFCFLSYKEKHSLNSARDRERNLNHLKMIQQMSFSSQQQIKFMSKCPKMSLKRKQMKKTT